MQALRKTAPNAKLIFEDVATPHPGDEEVLIAVRAAGICGTDLHIADGSSSYDFMHPYLPVTLGHEFAGTVALCGAHVSSLEVGQLVAIRPSITCGRCHFCLDGKEDDCVNRRGIGVTTDGGFASHVVVPARNCVPMPKGMSAEHAALIEPLSVGAEAAAVAQVKAGDTVLVIGPGIIGQAAALFAREAGAANVVIAGRDDRIRFETLRQLGFNSLCDTVGTELTTALSCNGLPLQFNAIIEASGSAIVVPQALALLGRRGVLSICGIHDRPVPVDLTQLVRKHQQIRGSYRLNQEAWGMVREFMLHHPQWLDCLISHRLPMRDALAGFELSQRREASKVMLVT